MRQSLNYANEEQTLSPDTQTLHKYFDKMGNKNNINDANEIKWKQQDFIKGGSSQVFKKSLNNLNSSKTIDFYDHSGMKDHRLNTFGRVDNDLANSDANSSSMRHLKQQAAADSLNRMRSKEKSLRINKVDAQRALRRSAIDS